MNTPRPSRVFVIQDMGFDYSDAQSFGELIYLLDKSEANVFNMPRVLALLKKRLWENHFRNSDYLLAVGAPSIMLATGVEASRIANGFRVLQWDREEKKYYVADLRQTA